MAGRPRSRSPTNMGACADRRGVRTRIGSLAEELGYDSLWMGEHVVAPSPRVPAVAAGARLPDPRPAGGARASWRPRHRARAAGDRDRDPAPAQPGGARKQLATLDVLSRGRLVFGMGVGYLEPEMRAIGVPMEGRGARADEYLQAMRVAVGGRRRLRSRGATSSSRVSTRIRVRCSDRIPVVVGGHSVAAHRRAVQHAAGWYGFMLDQQPRWRSRSLPCAVRPRPPEREPRRLHDHGQPGRAARPGGRARLRGAWESTGWCWCRAQDLSLEELEKRVRRNAPATGRRRAASA